MRYASILVSVMLHSSPMLFSSPDSASEWLQNKMEAQAQKKEGDGFYWGNINGVTGTVLAELTYLLRPVSRIIAMRPSRYISVLYTVT